MSSNSSPPRDLSPDDSLPPVEPPSAGFILQLFIVPLVIVVVVVMIWLMFNWLAQMGNDRDAFVRDLSRNTEARWQAAFNLANALRAERDSGNPRLTNDPQLAQKLAEILDRELASGSQDESSLQLRFYLCRALGEFKVTDGLPALIRAAGAQQDDKQAESRRAAIEGIALLAANVGAGDSHFAHNAQLDEVLLAAAADPDPRTRSVAAVALGVIGTQPFVAKLRFLLDDSNPDVRYNAATRLAHLGDAVAVPALVEMLDQQEQAGVEAEPEEKMRPFKRAVITINALRAAGQLAAHNPQADLQPLHDAIAKLLAGEVSPEIRVEAMNAQRQLDEARGGPTK